MMLHFTLLDLVVYTLAFSSLVAFTFYQLGVVHHRKHVIKYVKSRRELK